MTIKSIINWFKIAKPKPTNADIAVQIGCHYEEIAEFASACNDTVSADDNHETAEWYKRQPYYFDVDNDFSEKLKSFDRKEIADALGDQVVTAIGVGYMLGIDMLQVIAEIDRSNWTKFTKDDKGNYIPYIKPNGKIGKNPETYQEPQLERFIGDSR